MKPLAGVRLPSETRLAAGAVIATIMMVVPAGCGGGSDDGNIVARSDLGEVTRADLDTYILRLEADDRRPPEGTSLEAWRLGLLEKLLVEEALLADFDDQRDPMVEAARREVLMEAVEEIFVAPRTAISEEDLRRYYDEHPEEFGHPEQIRLRHIFKRVSRDATPEERDRVRQEMEALLNDIRSGASFGDLAREQSQSETAPLNGLIGRLSRGSLHPSVEKVVWGLNEGEVSDVVPTAVGFHISKTTSNPTKWSSKRPAADWCASCSFARGRRCSPTCWSSCWQKAGRFTGRSCWRRIRPPTHKRFCFRWAAP